MTTRSIHFTIPGRLGGKGRHRSFVQRGHVVHVAQQRTVSEEGIVRHFAAMAMRGQQLLRGPLALHLHISRHPPPSWSKKKQAIAHWITGKPDFSNVLKLLEDGMNKTVYDDDAQIASLQCTRIYQLATEEHIQIDVLELETS